MGLMCSLRGHDWSERELEDERDERGNEVVLTVREYEVCSRCDARNLVSENTEVTTVASTEDDAGEDETAATEAEPADEPADEAADEPADEAVEDAADTEDEEDAVVEGDDAAIIVDAEDTAEGGVPDADPGPAEDDTDAPTEPAAAGVDPADEDAMVMTDDDEPAEAAADAETGAPAPTAEPAAEPADPHENPETDDGVILPGEEEPSTDTERGHGEWPEHEQTAAPESGETKAWPEHESDDDGYDAQVPDDEAADVEFGGGLAPEAEGDGDDDEPEEGHDAEFVDNAVGRAPERERTERTERTEHSRVTDGESVTGITSASEVTAPSEGTSTSPDAQLVCPACGNAESRSRTSLRAGDICPECKRGYLAEADE